MTVPALLVPPSALAQEPFSTDLTTAPQVASTVTFVIKDHADIQGDRILFSDVAECQGVGEVCEETYGVMLGEAPAPGRMHVVSAFKIGQLMEAEWPDLKFTMTGAKFTRVQGVLQELPDDVLEAALRQEMTSRFSSASEEPGDFRVSLTRFLSRDSYRLRPGEYKIVFPELTDELLSNSPSAKRYFSGRQRRMQVELHQEKSVQRFVVTAEFSIQEYLPVATTDIIRGDVAEEKDFRLAWVETDRNVGSFVTQSKSLVGRRLKQAVVAGHPVEPSHLEVSVVAKRGQMALMSINKGGMVIQGQVKLLEKGGYGQVISAQYLKTKKKVRVKVIDSENVQLVL